MSVSILQSIEPFYFLAALFVGILLVYMTSPTPEIIVKYPTPENAKSSVFKDDADSCYKFQTETVACSNGIPELPLEKRKNVETFCADHDHDPDDSVYHLEGFKGYQDKLCQNPYELNHPKGPSSL